ncbi:hypothetical protein BDB01DRAFT_854145 [Pilobolus umbonatus]|nr:hypothetical protein BDB01DRAFT_854145 [Pilobolus umbonatus]
MTGSNSDWTILEKLLLTQAVYKHGENSWFQVARTLKQHCLAQGRPSDFFNQKNCSFQYYLLVENLEAENQLFKHELKNDMPTVVRLARQLYVQRVDEIKRKLKEDEEEFGRLVLDIDHIRSGAWDEKLLQDTYLPTTALPEVTAATTLVNELDTNIDNNTANVNLKRTASDYLESCASVNKRVRIDSPLKVIEPVETDEQHSILKAENISTSFRDDLPMGIREVIIQADEASRDGQMITSHEQESEQTSTKTELPDTYPVLESLEILDKSDMHKEVEECVIPLNSVDKEEIVIKEEDDTYKGRYSAEIEDNDISEPVVLMDKNEPATTVHESSNVGLLDEYNADTAIITEGSFSMDKQMDMTENNTVETAMSEINDTPFSPMDDTHLPQPTLSDPTVMEIYIKEEVSQSNSVSPHHPEELCQDESTPTASAFTPRSEGSSVNIKLEEEEKEELPPRTFDVDQHMETDVDTSPKGVISAAIAYISSSDDNKRAGKEEGIIDVELDLGNLQDTSHYSYELFEFNTDAIIANAATPDTPNDTGSVNVMDSISNDIAPTVPDASDLSTVSETSTIHHRNLTKSDIPKIIIPDDQSMSSPNIKANMSPEDEDTIMSETATPTASTPSSEKKRSREDQRQKSWLKNINLLWQEIANHKNGTMFMNPIKKSYAPLYYRVVKQPLDLKSIKYRVRDGVIKTTAEFERDIILMLTNSLMYNKEGTEMYMMAREMLEDVKEQIRLFKSADSYSVSFWENIDYN